MPKKLIFLKTSHILICFILLNAAGLIGCGPEEAAESNAEAALSSAESVDHSEPAPVPTEITQPTTTPFPTSTSEPTAAPTIPPTLAPTIEPSPTAEPLYVRGTVFFDMNASGEWDESTGLVSNEILKFYPELEAQKRTFATVNEPGIEGVDLATRLGFCAPLSRVHSVPDGASVGKTATGVYASFEKRTEVGDEKSHLGALGSGRRRTAPPLRAEKQR